MKITSGLVLCFAIPDSTNAAATSLGFKVLATSVMAGELCIVACVGGRYMEKELVTGRKFYIATTHPHISISRGRRYKGREIIWVGKG
jgi:hypothetical protein